MYVSLSKKKTLLKEQMMLFPENQAYEVPLV